ncbi:unnamed protein product [Lactuca saligna]|uniref:Uncharacterized protein n=1 Tax=Lactuca saligna TaxID=75948 RepID=A0AA35Y609_LACSI|nr:unnamed protein product [Lactuca saligna]
MEAMYRLVKEYKYDGATITDVTPEMVNLHVACGKCGKGIIVVLDLKDFKTTGPESCCEQRLNISVKPQLDEEQATAGIVSVVGNFNIQVKEIIDDDVEWSVTFQDGSFLRFRSKDQSWKPSGSEKKMKKVVRTKFLPKMAKEKRMKEMENEMVGWDEEQKKAEMMKRLKEKVEMEVEVKVKDSALSSLSWSDLVNEDEIITAMSVIVIPISK